MSNRYDRRAERGARWLDQHADPHWPERIDADLLDLASNTRCVLGQVFAAPHRLEDGFTYALDRTRPGVWPLRCGFIIYICTQRAERRQTEAWLRLLATRPIRELGIGRENHRYAIGV